MQEEIGDLKAEIRKLRSELELESELKALQTPVKTTDAPPLEQVISENKAIASAIQQQQFDIARVHSTLPPPLVRTSQLNCTMTQFEAELTALG